MGNGVSHRPESSTGKVILSDGTIHEYHTQLTAAELMLDHPRHMVVEISHPILNPRGSGKEITVNSKLRRPIIPIPADAKLDKDKLYFMMPMRNRGKPASFLLEEIQRLLLRSNYNSKHDIMNSTTGFVPLIVRFICTVKSESEIQSIVQMKNVRGRNCLEDKRELMTSDDEILDDRPEFVTAMSRQFSGRGWKPSLDTIIEKGVKQKVRHWLL